jgi:hypothetical protein
MTKTETILTIACIILIIISIPVLKEKRYFQNMTPEEIAQTKEIYHKLTTMSPGDIVTLAEEDKNIVPKAEGPVMNTETYMVKRVEESWASVIGPGPSSRIEEQKIKMVRFLEACRPDANLRITAVCRRWWNDEGWEQLATWWWLQ